MQKFCKSRRLLVCSVPDTSGTISTGAVDKVHITSRIAGFEEDAQEDTGWISERDARTVSRAAAKGFSRHF
jgi:hypothetical protein